MNEFMDGLFSQLFERERIFKFKSATVKGSKTLKIELLLSHDDYHDKLDEKLRAKVQEIASSLLPKEFIVEIDYIIAVHDESTLRRLMLEYIKSEKPHFFNLIAETPIQAEYNNDMVTVTITLEKFLHEYAVESKLENDLIAYFNTVVMEEPYVEFIEIPNSEHKEIAITEYASDPIRIIEVQPTVFYTKGDFQPVRYILDVMDKTNSSLSICGKISGITKRFIEKIKKYLYVFNIYDTTGTIKAKYFAKPSEKLDWDEVFCDDNTLLLGGSIEMDSFDNALRFMVRRVAACEVNYDSINVKSNMNKEYSSYRFIFPEPYVEISQESFFDDNTVSEQLLKNTFVVFDLETTGTDIGKDDITEIAAIKIENGRFTEQFSTFVRPSIEISAYVTELTGIKNEDVALAPLPQEVIPDFYKFTKGCVLVGHNIKDFDIPLLNRVAFKCHYEFLNDSVDTLLMARNVFPNGRNKLIDVCNRLHVPLIDAHRAINDVLANARCFLKLIKMQKNK